ncbi:LysR family transcriptional regulator [Acidaminobacter sp. JC074]|uniref:selenium metabolism-associated LysR family transcriptional regulator n=1 Tax=Acidaminobacter sp. JC074 TaxID=2530199 RepID=UPI001F10714C|nr:selenium metabolism-associated LysR family transcriptional regulator [Acidaminobacter sp. JC074]MCH4890738.1 LysR family transcriptional regulator [Acidaminobacter sp. JC074]
MNFKELQSFVAISKYKNFSKAAKALYLTQPTISHHIQTLEDELKTTILVRTSKSVSLTKAGQLLLIHAQKILNEKEQIHFMFDHYNGDISGELEIATSTIPSQFYLPQIIKDFSELHPKMKFKIEKLDSAGVHDKLELSTIDFGIVGAKSSQEFFSYEKILTDDIVLCCDFDNETTALTIEDLKTIPLIMREDGSGTKKMLLKALESHGIEKDHLNIFATIDDINTVKACIMGSGKFAFASRIAIMEDVKNESLKIIPIEGLEISRDFYFVYNKKHTLTPLSRTFKEYILSKV